MRIPPDKSSSSTPLDERLLNAKALSNFDLVIKHLQLTGEFRGDGFVCLNPTRDDKNLGSFSINTTSGLWKEFAGESKGGCGVVSFTAYCLQCSQAAAQKHMQEWLKDAATATAEEEAQGKRQVSHEQAQLDAQALWEVAQPDETHSYLRAKGLTGTYGTRVHRGVLLVPLRDKDGVLWNLNQIAVVPNGEGGFSKKVREGALNKGLFHAIGEEKQSIIYICTGFATAASVWDATHAVAICCGSDSNLSTVALSLKEKGLSDTFVIVGDNDLHTAGNPGRAAAEKAAGLIGCRYVVPDFDGVEGYSVTKKHSDFNDLHTLAGLDAVSNQLKNKRIMPRRSVFLRLATLDGVAYDQERKKVAKELGIRPSTVDKEVEASKNKETTGPQGTTIVLRAPEPWPEAVVGHEVLDEALRRIKQHMHMEDAHAVIATLWALHTHCWQLFPHTPRVIITAPSSESGKTVLLTYLLGALSCKAFPVELLAAAPFFRLTELQKPTWLIDEIDAFLKQDSDLPAAIQGGYQPNGGVVRCIGDDHEPRHFCTHSPVAMAGIKALDHIPQATQTRSFIITLEKAAPGDVEVTFDTALHSASMATLCRKMARWVVDNSAKIMPAFMTTSVPAINRVRDNWRPLYALAAVIGGEWPDRVKTAFQYEQASPSVQQPLQLQILSDIHLVIKPEEKGVTPADLIARLCGLEDSAWVGYNFRSGDAEHRKISSRQLSKLLNPYKCRTQHVRVGPTEKDVIWGYVCKSLLAAYKRYFSVSTSPESVTPLHVNEINDLQQKTSLHEKIGCNVFFNDNSLKNKECNDVTKFSPKSRKKNNRGMNSDERDPQMDIEEGIRIETAAQERRQPHSAVNPKSAQDEGLEIAQNVLTFYGVEVSYITDDAAAAAAIQILMAAEGVIGLDTETYPRPEYADSEGAALDPYLSEIRLIQLYHGSRAYVFDLTHVDKGLLQALLATHPLVAHNAVFDVKQLLHAGFNPRNVDDTLIMARAAGRHHGNRLEELATHFLKWSINKELQTSDWSSTPLTRAQITYAALDAVVVAKLYDALLKELNHLEQLHAYRLFQPMITVCAQQELLGVGWNTAAHLDLIQQWEGDKKTAQAALRAVVGPTLNLNSGSQLSAWLKATLDDSALQAWPLTEGKRELRTDNKTLSDFAHIPIVQPLIAYKRAAKCLTTFGPTLLAKRNPVTGRIHPRWNIHGQVTGKFSSGGPNFQQLPRGEDVRRLVVARPGCQLICADYGQLEIRVAAEVSRDAFLLKILAEGGDVHTLTAAEMSGKSVEQVTPDDRRGVKTITFGQQYGQGAAALAKTLSRTYGRQVTVSEAEGIRNQYFNVYNGLKRWQDNTYASATRTQQVRTALGRVRRFNETDRCSAPKAFPAVIAGSAADVMLLVLQQLRDALQGVDAHILLHVHDEVVLEAVDAAVPEAIKTLEHCMTAGFLAVFPEATTVNLVKAHAGQNWAEVKP